MKLFYCSIVSCLLASSLFAQEKKLLQNFKYRIDNFKAVNLTTGSGAGISNNDAIIGNTNNYLVGNLGGNALGLRSRDSSKFTLNFFTQNNFSFYRVNSGSNPQRQNAVSNASLLNVTKIWYKKDMFFELGGNVLGSFLENKRKDLNNKREFVFRNSLANFSTTFGLGTGRLENITDMQNALWLNRDLQANKNLTRTLTETELNNLGRTITKANNTRILDFRKRNKFLLKTVDGFLQENNLVEKTNIDYFNNLNDILFFAFNQPRLAGTEKFIRVSPSLFLKNDVNDNYKNFYKDERITTNKSVLVTVGIKTYKPKSLMHQNNYGVALTANIGEFSNTNNNYFYNVLNYQNKTKDLVNQSSLDFFYEHSIYPNTRTIINFEAKTSFGVQKVNDITSKFMTANIGANFNYFINYNTRFTANISGNYNNNKFDAYIPKTYTRGFQIQTRVGLDISL